MKILLAMIMTTLTVSAYGACTATSTGECSETQCKDLSATNMKFTYNAANTGPKCLATPQVGGQVATTCLENNGTAGAKATETGAGAVGVPSTGIAK